MATSFDPDRAGRSGLAVPDPKLNASQILAWVICWPWNALWTVCAYNPVFWLIEIAVREFRSGLEEISTGQFREIERELMGGVNTPPLVVAPHASLASRTSLVVGDPLPGWYSESELPVADKQPYSMPTQAVAVFGTDPETSAAGDALNEEPVEVSSKEPAAVDVVEADPWAWGPPCVVSDQRVSQQSANWYPAGELKGAPEVAATPLKSTHEKKSAAISLATPIPPSVLDAWGNLPHVKKGSSPTLN